MPFILRVPCIRFLLAFRKPLPKQSVLSSRSIVPLPVDFQFVESVRKFLEELGDRLRSDDFTVAFFEREHLKHGYLVSFRSPVNVRFEPVVPGRVVVCVRIVKPTVRECSRYDTDAFSVLVRIYHFHGYRGL